MPNGFNADVNALQRHAGEIDSLMDTVTEATASAGAPIDLNAFGIIGSTWSWKLNDWTGNADEFIKTATDCGTEIAKRLREMAGQYEHLDEETRNSVQSIQDNLDDAYTPKIRQGDE